MYCLLHRMGCTALRVDLVLVGAEGVVENGGVINKLGTYQIALSAKSLNKPFYVAAESYKFARLYPLNQQVGVIRNLQHGTRFGSSMPSLLVRTKNCTYVL